MTIDGVRRSILPTNGALPSILTITTIRPNPETERLRFGNTNKDGSVLELSFFLCDIITEYGNGTTC